MENMLSKNSTSKKEFDPVAHRNKSGQKYVLSPLLQILCCKNYSNYLLNGEF